jgi:glycosyltransferase involved in cell wall biosynthesis
MSWVTILTPLFNGIIYFEECYNSIINQTEKNFTWIIGINGHGDDDNDVYKMLKHKISDERVIVKNYLTKGKVDTLNEMIKIVETPYVALCDCDDVWILNKLEVQKQILDKYNFTVYRNIKSYSSTTIWKDYFRYSF